MPEPAKAPRDLRRRQERRSGERQLTCREPAERTEPDSVRAIAEEAGIGDAVTVVAAGDTVDVAGFTVTAVGGRHAEIYDGLPGCANLGYGNFDAWMRHKGGTVYARIPLGAGVTV